MSNKIVATLIGIKGQYEGKTYAQQVIVTSDVDQGTMLEVKQTLAEHLGDALMVPKIHQDDDWINRFRLFGRPMTQDDLDRFLARA